MINRENWELYAACKDIKDPEIFEAKPRTRDERKAKEICNACPVQEPCLESELSMPPETQTDGVIGGLNKMERLALMRKRGKFVPQNV